MGFTVVCLPNEEFDQSGFDTKQEGIKYIEALVCNDCLNDIKKGYVEIEDDGEETRYEIADVLDTSCGSSFIIISDEDYDSADTLEDLLIAAGMTPADQKTEDSLTPEQKSKIIEKEEELKKEEEKKDTED